MPRRSIGSRLKEFERYASAAMRLWQVPGMAVAIVDNYQLIYAGGFGFKEANGTDPVDTKTVFQIGSVSKSFTSALAAMLADKGKFRWDDKVRIHLPDFRLSDAKICEKFLVEDLMSQCSSLPAHSGRFLPHLGFTADDIIHKLRFIRSDGIYRKDYAYQNNLFLVAASLIEKYSGQSWKKFLAFQILAPLGMFNTTASLKGYLNCTNKACGHYYGGPSPTDPVKLLPLTWPYHYWIYTIAPAAGINSNIMDMARWLEFHLRLGVWGRVRLISERNCRFTHTPKTPAGKGVWGETRYYCQGWLQSEYNPCPILWHNGGTSGMKSIVAMAPLTGTGIVILCNLHDPLLPEALVKVFFDLWFEHPFHDCSYELFNERVAASVKLQASPAPNTPPRPLVKYVGTYFNDLYGRISVSIVDRKLRLTIGPQKMTWPLKPWGGDTFVFNWPGIFSDGAGVQFNAGRTGTIASLTIEGMNDDITGMFHKISKSPGALSGIKHINP